jgi:beta-lactam-binding protein with PASTA domain
MGYKQCLHTHSILCDGKDTLEEMVNDPELIGSIISQQPEAYEDVLPGSAVTVTLGIPSDVLLETDVVVDLTGLPRSGEVVVTLADEEGTESVLYTQEFEETPGSVTVTLYSSNPRNTYYSVYFDGEVVARHSVTFKLR